MKTTTLNLRLFSICLGLALLLSAPSVAYAIKWTGSDVNDRTWSNPKSWEGGIVPGPGDSVEIFENVAFLDVAATVANVTLSGCCDGGLIYKIGGGSLTVLNRLEINTAGGLVGESNFDVVIANTATLVFSGPSPNARKVIHPNVTLHNAGRIEWRGGPVFFDGTLNNSGLFVIFGDAGFGSANRAGVINNTGRIEKQTGNGTTQFAGQTPETNAIATVINNKGVVAVASGTIEMGYGTSDGEFLIGNAHSLIFRYPHTFDGARFTGAGTCSLEETMTFRGHIKSTADLELVTRAGIIGGDNTHPEAFLEGSGRFIWKGGVIFGSFTLADDVHTIITGPDQKGYDAVLTNKGTMDWFGPGALNSDAATLRNEGTFNVLAPGTFHRDEGPHGTTFENIGTLNTFAGGTSVTTNALILNRGILNIGGVGGAGILQVSSFEQTTTGTLAVELLGENAVTPQFDQLVGGSKTLHGRLDVSLAANYEPPLGASFRIVDSASGKFDLINVNSDRQFRANYDGGLNLVLESLVRITSPQSNTTVPEGQGVPVTAEVGNGVTQIAFYDNGRLVQSLTAAPFTVQLTGLAPGVHLITAIATAPGGSDGRSEIRIVVDPLNGTTYTFSGPPNGAWTDANNWTPAGVPGTSDSAIVSNSAVMSADVIVRAFSFEAGECLPSDCPVLGGPGNMTVTENFLFLSGTIHDADLLIPAGGNIALLSNGFKTFQALTLDTDGTMIASGAGSIDGGTAIVNNRGYFTFAFQRDTSTGQHTTELTVGTFNNHSTVDLDGGSLKTTGEYVQMGGETSLGCARVNGNIAELEGELEAVNVAMESGTMRGSGTIVSNLITRVSQALFAYISMGCSPGTIEVTGDLTLTDNATIIAEIGGTNPAQYDQLKVGGTATLNGKLIVKSVDNFTPAQTDTFNIITYGTKVGVFDSVSSNGHISLGDKGAVATITGENPPGPKALNIATRMKVETGDNALIAGFIITGSVPKKVIIRGIGPSLPFGGVLANPTLELDGGAVTNDNWRTNQEQEIIATTIPPSNDLEAAIVGTLNPGSHTAILRGNGGATGIGVVEVYDLDSGAPAQLANISSRGFVQSGDDVMIGGFIISGDYPARVLIHAIGPSLPFSGKLENPTLELVDQNGGRISNDNWRATQEAEIIATTIPPTKENEAAILATLVPGNYTAIVRGSGGTTGIAVVEAYNLQ